MPGLPAPKPDRHRRRPQSPAKSRQEKQPAPVPRLRLAWSRAIVDQNCTSAPPAPAEIPHVRSTAAMRARAGMTDPVRVPVALDTLLRTSAHSQSGSLPSREYYRPAPDLVPVPEPTLGQRFLHWITGIIS